MRTPCGRFIGSRSYSLSWAPTFRGCLALPCCAFIIAHFAVVVKRNFHLFWSFLHRLRITPNPLRRWLQFPLDAPLISRLGHNAKSYIFPRRYLARTSSKEVSGFEPPSVPPKFVMRSRTALHPGTNQGLLLYLYCITTWVICQEEFSLSLDFFYSVYHLTHFGVLWTPP